MCGNAAIGVETAKSTVAVVEDAGTLFDKRLDVVD